MYCNIDVRGVEVKKNFELTYYKNADAGYTCNASKTLLKQVNRIRIIIFKYIIFPKALYVT